MIEVLTAAFKEAAAARLSTGGELVMRRLTNYEYNNTLNDLLALNEDFSKDFPPDSISEEGFKNNGYYMGMSALQIENYVEAAKRAVDEAIFEGEQPELKTIDIKDVKSIQDRNGKAKPVNHSGGRGALYWKDHPQDGPVVVDITLSGVKDTDRIDRLPFFQVKIAPILLVALAVSLLMSPVESLAKDKDKAAGKGIKGRFVKVEDGKLVVQKKGDHVATISVDDDTTYDIDGGDSEGGVQLDIFSQDVIN